MNGSFFWKLAKEFCERSARATTSQLSPANRVFRNYLQAALEKSIAEDGASYQQPAGSIARVEFWIWGQAPILALQRCNPGECAEAEAGCVTFRGSFSQGAAREPAAHSGDQRDDARVHARAIQ